MFLEKLILKCEAARRSYVTRLGLSYPANFGPRARRRLDQVIAELLKCREATHPGLEGQFRIEKVSTRDSTPDEASAVAIEFVHNADRFRSTIKERLGQDGKFLVASFDFGGGSIDTALLLFTRLPTTLPKFLSRHLSLGGDELFGGDNVTIAAFHLLLKGVRQATAEILPAAEFPVEEAPNHLASDTEPSNNHQRLRVLAETFKRFLCESHRTEAPKAARGAALERLDVALLDFFERITLRPRAEPEILRALRDRLRETALKLTLDDVYDQEVFQDAERRYPYTVRERVERCVQELRRFVEVQNPDVPPTCPLFLVLAGAACRLPLVGQLLAHEFRDWLEPRDAPPRARPRPSRDARPGSSTTRPATAPPGPRARSPSA